MRFFKRFYAARSLRVLDSLTAYRLWSPSYMPAAHNALMRAEEAAMRALLPSLSGLRVLDLACGTGRYGRLAREMDAACIISLDHSLPMLKAGQVSESCVADVSAIPLASGSIDVIICGLAFGHVKELRTPLQEISRVLTPGGVACISDFHPYQTLSGAQRTFVTEQGRSYAVEHYLHLTEEYVTLALEHGLQVQAVREPRIKDHRELPVALLFRFVRSG